MLASVCQEVEKQPTGAERPTVIKHTNDLEQPKFNVSKGIQCSRLSDFKDKYCKSRKNVKRLEKKIKTLNKMKSEFSKNKTKVIVKNYLKKAGHSDTSIKHIMNPAQSSFRNYTEEEIAKALIMRNMSPQVYEYQRKNNILPLPSKVTLNKWLSKFKVDEGIQYSMIEILAKKCQETHSRANEAVLVFDEINRKYAYDPRNKKVYGNKSKIQVVMARSLFSTWKQVIYVHWI